MYHSATDQGEGRRASMGPRSDNRGYAGSRLGIPHREESLQWVHGQITVVMERRRELPGPRLVASMGPRSDNRGYVPLNISWALLRMLQWVHGQITVVMPAICEILSKYVPIASMGPRSDNRGYEGYRV